MKRWVLVAWALSGCSMKAEKPAVIAAEPATPRPAPAAQAKVEGKTMKALGAQGELAAGWVSWEGMVLPTKGGFSVRGVTVDDTLFVEKLRASSIDGDPSDPEWFLGAVVRVSGELAEASHDGGQPGGLAVQSRAGRWFHPTRVDAVELVKNAAQIEGKIERSKGFMAVGEYLVSRHDLDWSLAGKGRPEGARVRLWGQPRVYVCGPNEQCLTTGSLPIFEVARARLLP